MNKQLDLEHLVAVRPAGPGNWSPDGKWIAFVWADRSGASHLWICPSDGGWLRQLSEKRVTQEMGEGTDRRDVWGGPQWSPDSSRLVFPSQSTWDSRQVSLWSVGLDGEDPIELTQHNGSDSTPRWSPDGKFVAFSSHRNGRDDLQIVPAEGGVALQLTYDRWDNIDLDWSPDGKYLAYISQRSDTDLFSNNICVVPAAGGMPVQLTAGDTFNDRTPRWSPDGKHIAFVTNRNDDDDIWIVGAEGSYLRPVAAGKGEKADPQWSPDGTRIAYTHYLHGEISVCVVTPGESPRVIAAGGCNVAPRWSPDGSKLLYLRSSHDQPSNLWCKSAEAAWSDPGTPLTHCDLGRLDGIAFSRPECITYPSEDGLAVEGLLYRPTEKNAAPGPAIVYVHGGPNLAHVNGWYPYLQHLLQRGYTILAPNYRGSTGYGKAFMESNIGDKAGGDLADWVGAATYLRSLPEIDPRRVAIMGRSAGGYATLLALGQVPDVFQAGVAISAPSSWFSYWDETELAWTRRFRMKLMGLPVIKQELYRRRSPVYHAANFRAPVLILHGAADPGVPVGQAKEMAAELARFGKKHKCFIYEGEGHQSTGVFAIMSAARETEAFLAENLAG
jgi:dipeptidyl aminopeptidase/acylaminoacyl peptidase